MYSLNIIGAGHCGKALGLLLKNTQKVYVQGVCNQHLQSTKEAIDFLGGGKAFVEIADLPPADLTLIACPDDAIEKCAKTLSSSQFLNTAGIVFHCSGSKTSDSLEKLKRLGCLVASIHPLMGFADSLSSVASFAGCYCGLEGDSHACAILEALFFDMGAHVFILNKTHKQLYHAGAVCASNYLVTLAKSAQSLMIDAGIEHEKAKNIIISLMSYSLENIKNHDTIEKALTGPIKRADLKTLKAHLGVLPEESMQNLYRTLGLETIKLTNLETDIKAQIINILINKE